MTSFRDSRFFIVPSQWDPIPVKFWGTLHPSAVRYQDPKSSGTHRLRPPPGLSRLVCAGSRHHLLLQEN
jgi:hypothetical protein